MATHRAFKNLASLRDSFREPFLEEPVEPAAVDEPAAVTAAPTPPAPLRLAAEAAPGTPIDYRTYASPPKVDGRRLRKVLKTPSVSLSVAVRAELHEDISAMLFARKSTWIALLDELLTEHVQRAKEDDKFPK